MTAAQAAAHRPPAVASPPTALKGRGIVPRLLIDGTPGGKAPNQTDAFSTIGTRGHVTPTTYPEALRVGQRRLTHAKKAALDLEAMSSITYLQTGSYEAF